MPVKEYLASLSDNPYFGAGFGLVGVGSAALIFRRIAGFGGIWFRRKCMMSLEVNNSDKSYLWLLEWINSNASTATQHLSVETSFIQSDSGKVLTNFTFIPGLGDHYIFHAGRWLKIERNRDSKVLFQGSPYESVTLTTFGRDRRYFSRILNQAKDIALQNLQTGIKLFTPYGHEWRMFGHPNRKRPLDSVVLGEGISERIVNDVKEFIANASWYIERGVPYRRGYLLYGSPGCGKSSFIFALASELEYSICVLNLGDRSLTEDRFHYLLNMAPLKSIVLLEDIDAAFVSREESPEMRNMYAGLTRITFSGFLNALDGVASSEGRILFMTTNYVDRLDPALIRPGRVDFKQHISYCSPDQMKKMFTRFYHNLPEVEKKAEEFLGAILSEKLPQNQTITAAQIQGHLLMHKTDYKMAIENIERLIAKK